MNNDNLGRSSERDENGRMSEEGAVNAAARGGQHYNGVDQVCLQLTTLEKRELSFHLIPVNQQLQPLELPGTRPLSAAASFPPSCYSPKQALSLLSFELDLTVNETLVPTVKSEDTVDLLDVFSGSPTKNRATRYLEDKQRVHASRSQESVARLLFPEVYHQAITPSPLGRVSPAAGDNGSRDRRGEFRQLSAALIEVSPKRLEKTINSPSMEEHMGFHVLSMVNISLKGRDAQEWINCSPSRPSVGTLGTLTPSHSVQNIAGVGKNTPTMPAVSKSREKIASATVLGTLTPTSQSVEFPPLDMQGVV